VWQGKIDASERTAEVKCTEMLRSVLARVEGRTPSRVKRLNPRSAKSPKGFRPPELTPQLADTGYKHMTVKPTTKAAELLGDQPADCMPRLLFDIGKKLCDVRQRFIRVGRT
jgi:hypothetical protein